MTCPYCNRNLPDGAVYCPSCRVSLVQSTTDFQGASNQNDNSYTTDSTTSDENNNYANNPNRLYNTYFGDSNDNNSYANNPNRLYNTYSGNSNDNNSYANNPNRLYNTYSGNSNDNNYANNPNRSYNSYPNNRISKPTYPSYLTSDDAPTQDEYFPMTWYKILTYVLLPLGIISNLYSAKRLFNGEQYLGMKEIAYTLFESLKVVDTAAGIFCVVLSVWMVLTFVWLLQKKKIAPISLCGCYILNYGATVLLYAAYNMVLPFGNYTFIWIIIRSILIGGILTVVNYKYFDKRRSLFVN